MLKRRQLWLHRFYSFHRQRRKATQAYKGHRVSMLHGLKHHSDRLVRSTKIYSPGVHTNMCQTYMHSIAKLSMQQAVVCYL